MSGRRRSFAVPGFWCWVRLPSPAGGDGILSARQDVNRSQLAAGITGIVALLAGGLGLSCCFRGVLRVADRWSGRLVVLAGVLFHGGALGNGGADPSIFSEQYFLRGFSADRSGGVLSAVQQCLLCI